MDALDAWAGSPAFISDPFSEPSLELGTPAGWAPGALAAEGLLGEIDLAATPAAVRLARSYVRELAGEFFGAGAAVLEDLELLTSETVTNAVVHAAPLIDGMIMLAVLHVDRHVRVEITDGGPMPGGPGPADDPLAARGRGLRLVQALAVEHGRHHNTDGTATFWFEVAVDAHPGEELPGDAPDASPLEEPERWLGGWVMP
ncbi:ATP-binding protein [Actinomadura rugatobispora]|uniref:ATP-binding protein n=1 Tax=Actinomadura rugatobispora TaxID=1994 RepID=A0ABW1A7F1_9ACTN|nr:hypothetical protein GCM10010200_026110 [Actinomadura rugatobispora]